MWICSVFIILFVDFGGVRLEFVLLLMFDYVVVFLFVNL